MFPRRFAIKRRETLYQNPQGKVNYLSENCFVPAQNTCVKAAAYDKIGAEKRTAGRAGHGAKGKNKGAAGCVRLRAGLPAGRQSAGISACPGVGCAGAEFCAPLHRCTCRGGNWCSAGAIQQLAQPLGRWQAAALQAVLFAVQHGTPAGMAWALGCGLVLGALRERTGRVWPGMLLHTLNNLLVFAAG